MKKRFFAFGLLMIVAFESVCSQEENMKVVVHYRTGTTEKYPRAFFSDCITPECYTVDDIGLRNISIDEKVFRNLCLLFWRSPIAVGTPVEVIEQLSLFSEPGITNDFLTWACTLSLPEVDAMREHARFLKTDAHRAVVGRLHALVKEKVLRDAANK